MRIIFPSVFLIVFGLVLFSNLYQAPFFRDDIAQIVKNEQIKDLGNVRNLFFQKNGFFGGNDTVAAYYYKPVFYTFYALLYAAGEGSPLAFHTFQIFLHSLNAVLVFLLFRKFFGSKKSFLLALIFLVHPANEETVGYIAALQDVLFLFFGLLALMTVSLKKAKSVVRVFACSFLILLSCLSKETGLLFAVIVVLYASFFKEKLVRIYLFAFAVVGYVYFLLRDGAVQNSSLVMTEINQETLLIQRLFNIPRLFFYYLEELIIPSPYLPEKELLQGMKFDQIVMSVFVLIFGLALFVVLIYLLWRYFRSSFYQFVFFTTWAFLGISIHLQILPLDVPVATRWLYFPMVGFLGMVGVIISILKPYFSRYKVLLLIMYFLYLSSFIFATVKINILRRSGEPCENQCFQNMSKLNGN